MSSKPRTVKAVRTSKVFPAKDFAKRLDTAIQGHPKAIHGHGKQKWLKEAINDKFGTTLTAEALRKWFAGEARPRVKAMSQIAEVLGVDEAWLSLGLKPDETAPRFEASQRSCQWCRKPDCRPYSN